MEKRRAWPRTCICGKRVECLATVYYGAAERLKEAQIEQMDAVQLIRRFNHKDVLIYCDPPYVLQKRHGKQYRCEMDDSEHKPITGCIAETPGSRDYQWV